MAQVPESSDKAERVITVDVAPELSLKDIDDAIAEEDPEFLAKVNEIAADKSLSMAEISSNDDQALNDERERLARLGRLGKIPFLPYLTLRLRKLGRVASDLLTAMMIRLKNFFYYLRNEGKEKGAARLREILGSIKGGIGAWAKFLGHLPIWGKLLFLGTLLLTGFTGYFVYRSWTYGVIAKEEELFLKSLESVADKVYEYNPLIDTEPFYENLKGESNLFIIPKMVVNVKKSKGSGPNPMASFEFFIEGYASEAIIEFKDREVEFRDLVQRTIEDYSFDQLESADGKRELCLRIQKVINSKLTTAQLKKVFIKTVIIKP